MNRRMHNVFVPLLAIAALGMDGFNAMHEAATTRVEQPSRVGEGAYNFGSSQRQRRKWLRRMTHQQRARHLARNGRP